METPLLRSIFNHLGEGVMVVDKEGFITQMNPAASRILGGADLGHQTLGEALETFECFTDDQTARYVPERLPLARAMRGEHVIEEPMFVRNSTSHEETWLCVTATPILDDDGQPAGAVRQPNGADRRQRRRNRGQRSP